jgi:hypothetical protein
LVAAFVVYVVGIGGDAFPGFRLLVVPLPFLCLLAADAVTHLPQRARLGAAVLLVAGTAVGAWMHPRHRRLDIAIADDYVTRFKTAALWMKQNFAPGAVLAYSGAGLVPYYGEMRVIDTLGSTDRHIARTPVPRGQFMAGHEKGDGAYVLGLRPEYICFGAPLTKPGPVFRTDQELVQIREFAEQYELVQVPLRYVARRTGTRHAPTLFLYRRITPSR